MGGTPPLADPLDTDWKHNPRWQGVKRPYSAAAVLRLRGTVHVEHSLARRGAEKFWSLLHSEPVIGALGCMSGNQAVQAVQAGLPGLFLSGRPGGRGRQFPRRKYSGPRVSSGGFVARPGPRAQPKPPPVPPDHPPA